MRETIFRGISIRTGKFVYGDYFSRWRGDDKGTEYYIVEHPFGKDSGREVMHKIDNTTLGESTSVVDRNSTLIFENDIVRVFSFSKSMASKDTKQKTSVRTVKWGKTPDGVGFNVTAGENYLYEVVSNIYNERSEEAALWTGIDASTSL